MIAALSRLVPLALEGQWKGWAATALVLTGAAVFIGTPYILLASNFGMRKAFHIIVVSFSAFMILICALWLFGAPGTIPGTGPRYSEPKWIPFLADSQQGQQFAKDLETFPDGWDKVRAEPPYSGAITSAGEFLTAKSTMTTALARLAEFNGLRAVDRKDWDFRNADAKPTPAEEELPPATVRFKQVGSVLMMGVEIPGTPKHRAVTVFALRDKGKVFLWPAVFLGVSILTFAFSTWVLARLDEKEKRRASESPVGTAEPVRV